MPSEFALISSDDPEWDERLAPVPDDVYHRAGYHRFTEETERAKAFLAVFREPNDRRGLLWPYLLRPVADVPQFPNVEGFDVDCVYGYPGPLAWGCQPGDEFTRKSVDALVDLWRSQGALTAFTRFHPLLENVRWGMGLPAGGPMEASRSSSSVRPSQSPSARTTSLLWPRTARRSDGDREGASSRHGDSTRRRLVGP